MKRQGLKPFFDDVLSLDVCAARRQIDDDVALFPNPIHDLFEEFKPRTYDACFRIAYMDVVIAAPALQHSIAASAISLGVYGTAGFIPLVGPSPTTATEIIVFSIIDRPPIEKHQLVKSCIQVAVKS